jgi:hypothetical protein
VVALAQIPAANTADVVIIAVAGRAAASVTSGVRSAVADILTAPGARLVITVIAGVVTAGEKLVRAETDIVSAVL